MTRKKILVATDIPFWRNSTGAEVRIQSVCRFLSRWLKVEVFFLGRIPPEDDQLVNADPSIEIRSATSDQVPDELTNRLKWYAGATLNQARQWLGRTGTGKSGSDRSLTLNDFKWDWATTRFSETVNRFHPDFILIEYVKLGYLLEGLADNQREQIACLIDTHDILSSRARQFEERGYRHWISIDSSEEISALRQFDLIMAIQRQEAEWFRTNVVGPETIVVGYSASLPCPSPPRAGSDPFVVGYLGSSNASNYDAIRNFIERGWKPTDKEQSPDGPKRVLRIYGSVCQAILESGASLPGSVELVDNIGELSEFYDHVDLVINPVEFGTGLKIKNCEAVVYGLPLLTTKPGFEGMPDELREVVEVVEDLETMGRVTVKLSQSPARLAEMRETGRRLANSLFSDEQAYSELKVWLERRI